MTAFLLLYRVDSCPYEAEVGAFDTQRYEQFESA